MTAKHLQALGLCLLIVGIAILGVGGYFLALPEQYKAMVRIRIDDSPAPAQLQPGESHDPYFSQSDFEAIQSEPILDKVVENLDLNERWGKQFLGAGSLKTSESHHLLKQQLSLVLNIVPIEIQRMAVKRTHGHLDTCCFDSSKVVIHCCGGLTL